MSTDFDSLFTLEEILRRFLKERTKKTIFLTEYPDGRKGTETYHHPFEIRFKFRTIKNRGTRDAEVSKTPETRFLYLVNHNTRRGDIFLQDSYHVQGCMNRSPREYHAHHQNGITFIHYSDLKTIKDRLEFCETILDYGTPIDSFIDDIEDGGFQEPVTRWDVRKQLEKEQVA